MEASIDPVAGIEWLAALFPVRAPRRGALTVMFTDIAGFTAYAATRGDRAAARLLHRHDRAVLPAIRRHSGRILKRLGDGLMAVFASPAAALRAALEMQQAARGVRLRIGIHAGAARSRAGDLIGHEVNVAARIAERALGGEILVSDAVRGAADGLAARFRPVRALVIAGREPRPLFRAQATTMSAACQTASKARCTETA
jgi:adenylate cyclase